MKILEVLNAYPGETFLQVHATALLAHSDCQLSWAFTQTHFSDTLPKPVKGLHRCFAIPNFNRMPKWRKTVYRLANPFNSWDTLKKRAILRSIAKSQPDIIHFQFAGTAIQWAWAADELKVPYTLSLRGSDVQVAPYTKEDYINQLQTIGWKAASVHAVCESLKDQFCTLTFVHPEKVKVIRTTISPEWGTIKRTPEPGNLLSVGRLHWTKGYPDLLLAAHQLQQDKIDFNLSIIGEGPERPMLEFMIRDLGLQERVRLEGKKSHAELRDYFAKAQVFVLSSLQEGFPNSLAEAMMAGVPVISTNCNGIKEVFGENHDPFLANVGDPFYLADKIKSFILKKNQDKNELVIQNKSLAKMLFHPEVHANEFINFFKYNS